MNFVRIFHHSIDVMPRRLIGHFLRYLGYYIIDDPEAERAPKSDSALDIYVISNAFMEHRPNELDIENPERTIIICCDDWTITEGVVHVIRFNNEKERDSSFLQSLADCIADITLSTDHLPNRLLADITDLRPALSAIAQAYSECCLFQCSLYARCFYEQHSLYRMALKNYTNFINTIRTDATPGWDSDLFKYAANYAKLEANITCKKNSYIPYYPVEEMLRDCTELLKTYEDYEQILLLRADIYSELLNKWTQAGNEYGRAALTHCSYANYKWGRIIRKYVEDYSSALNIEKLAVSCKRDYFNAWYQIALCQEAEGKFIDEIESLENICKILNPKYRKHLLSPIELEYLYKAVIKIIQIETQELGDYASARLYEGIERALKDEAESTGFLELVWPDSTEDTDLIALICQSLQQQLTSV